MRCDSCEALMINGFFCHETGCPNMNSRYDVDEDQWIRQRKCFECGCTVDVDDPCCWSDGDWDDEDEFQDEYACDFCEDNREIDGEPCGWCTDVSYTVPRTDTENE